MKETTTEPEELNDDLDNLIHPNEKPNPINVFIQKNGKMIIIFCIAVIVIVGLVMLFRSNSQKNEATAAHELSRIETYYVKGDYENALKPNDTIPTVRGEKVVGLLSIVDEYGSTLAGQRATLYAADAYYALGKFAEAKTYYDKAIGSSIDVIKIGGLAGMAACSEKDGKFKEAADGYTQAANLITDDQLRLRYLYFSGLCNEKAGNKDAAKQVYRDIINLNKFGEYMNLAKAGITRLGEPIE
jgi:tetratricopeptide (TPR) repeat protein